MPVFIAKVMLQDVTNEEIYNELDKAMANEDGYAPFLRFFIKNVLWEVGAGFDGTTKFNFMVHL